MCDHVGKVRLQCGDGARRAMQRQSQRQHVDIDRHWTQTSVPPGTTIDHTRHKAPAVIASPDMAAFLTHTCAIVRGVSAVVSAKVTARREKERQQQRTVPLTLTGSMIDTECSTSTGGASDDDEDVDCVVDDDDGVAEEPASMASTSNSACAPLTNTSVLCVHVVHQM
jgi:hypothetical protein